MIDLCLSSRFKKDYKKSRLRKLTKLKGSRSYSAIIHKDCGKVVER